MINFKIGSLVNKSIVIFFYSVILVSCRNITISNSPRSINDQQDAITKIQLNSKFESDTSKGLSYKLKSIDYYLRNDSISIEARNYYNDNLKLDDSKAIFSIIDSLQSKNITFLPFYIFLTSKIMVQSDGALSEYLCISAKQFCESRAYEFLSFFNENNEIEEKYLMLWAKCVGSEIAIECENKEENCLKDFDTKMLIGCKSDSSSLLKLKSRFVKMVKKSI